VFCVSGARQIIVSICFHLIDTQNSAFYATDHIHYTMLIEPR
jgi:hypothetical protein